MTSQPPINIGIIGAGERGAMVYENIAKTAPKRVRLVSVFDSIPERMNRLLPAPGANEAKLAGSFQEVIDDPRIDAVIITTPNGLHREPAVQAAQARAKTKTSASAPLRAATKPTGSGRGGRA